MKNEKDEKTGEKKLTERDRWEEREDKVVVILAHSWKRTMIKECKPNNKTPGTESVAWIMLFLCRWISVENGPKLVKLFYCKNQAWKHSSNEEQHVLAVAVASCMMLLRKNIECIFRVT